MVTRAPHSGSMEALHRLVVHAEQRPLILHCFARGRPPSVAAAKLPGCRRMIIFSDVPEFSIRRSPRIGAGGGPAGHNPTGQRAEPCEEMLSCSRRISPGEEDLVFNTGEHSRRAWTTAVVDWTFTKLSMSCFLQRISSLLSGHGRLYIAVTEWHFLKADSCISFDFVPLQNASKFQNSKKSTRDDGCIQSRVCVPAGTATVVDRLVYAQHIV